MLLDMFVTSVMFNENNYFAVKNQIVKNHRMFYSQMTRSGFPTGNSFSFSSSDSGPEHFSQNTEASWNSLRVVGQWCLMYSDDKMVG